MRSTARTFAIGALSLAAAVVLVGCTGDDDPSPTGSSSVQPSESSAESMTRAELESAVFDEESGSSEVLGSAEGAVPDPLAPHPARIDVNAVIADETSTTVWFTLVNTEDTDPLLQFSAFNKLRPLSDDIRDIALVDTVAEQRLQPYIGQRAGTDSNRCTCSDAPLGMSSVGMLLSGVFPPVEQSTSTVTLEIPGFAPIENLPVTRS
ncbi:hypothetical protein ASD16_02130 [Cellulomonas sp. Root485]|uniref:hypothetical protein n=1 Tax=Cellulomonas sp. Root485 TaxID=1736546 RepID=UPI0006FBD445|nr:hypothetical protein [Cellulomonas sp. Root485]KQY24366.1 hypothetical protein ASD16_02130 [Cellulomonas sp. Root485]